MPHKFTIIILLIIYVSFEATAQNSPLTQWSNNTLSSNPSLAGSANKIRTNLFYRNQWIKTESGFHYYGVSFDMPINKNTGIGAEITNEHTSAFVEPHFYGTYSYLSKITRNISIRFGIKAGVFQDFINVSDLKFEQEEHITTEASKVKIDAGLGICAVSKDFFVGFIAEHLTKPKQGLSSNVESRTCIKWTVNGGYMFKTKKHSKKSDIEIMPNFIFQLQGAQQNIQIGVISRVDKVLFGTAVRKNISTDSPTASFIIGMKTSDLTIAYNYDIDTNPKTFNMGNAHEISITKLFDQKHKKKRKPIECPSFLR